MARAPLALSGLRRLPAPAGAAGYPWDLPALTGLDRLPFDTAVTAFVGENGSGKSTLLEAIALAAGAVTLGAAELDEDAGAAAIAGFARTLRLEWRRRDHRGFFLRAEDYLGYARRMAALRAELEAELARVDREFSARPGSLAHDLARTPHVRGLTALDARYGPGLEARSHGEGYLALLQARLVPGGLFLLDEPEAALSPARQLGLLALLRDAVEAGGQVVMATHSPILLAFPGAAIWSFDEVPMAAVAWDTLDHVRLTRDFLREPEAYLRHL
jgi:predicted ATPase